MIGPYETPHAFRMALEERLRNICQRQGTDLQRPQHRVAFEQLPARLATGAEDHFRQLYTDNQRGRIRYRYWLALTSRTPETRRRDDLADRLLLLPMERIRRRE